MFPLGTVLFPYAVLPLHVFEPRYRALTEHCLAGDGCFGVVLIERGSEVGGGDTRFAVGTVARIARAGQLPDGRYVLATVGTQRFRVREWLPDDPYPLAEVDLLDDPGAGADTDQCEEVGRLLRRVLALRAELGEPGPGVDVELTTDDVTRAGYEAAALAPLGPLDAQALLELDDPGARLSRLAHLLTDEARLLEFRLSSD
jgi:Lon protease-like protein